VGRSQFMSAVPAPEPEVDVPLGVMDGKQIGVHGTTLVEREEVGLYDTGDPMVTVFGEDLARETLVIFNQETGHVLWANPAQPGIRRLIKAARLLMEVQAEYDASVEPEPLATATPEAFGITDPQEAEKAREGAALAYLESDDRVEAVTLMGEEWVQRVEAEGGAQGRAPEGA
jgi:hypothetical protein